MLKYRPGKLICGHAIISICVCCEASVQTGQDWIIIDLRYKKVYLVSRMQC